MTRPTATAQERMPGPICAVTPDVGPDARGVSFATVHVWDFWSRYPSMRRVVWFT